MDRATSATVDLVATSEPYGAEPARRLGSERLHARGGVWSAAGCVPEYGRVHAKERVVVQRTQHAHAGRPGVPEVEDLGPSSADPRWEMIGSPV